MKQKGFTLIELMVVVVILGILAGIAVPKMFGLSDKSKVQEAPTALKTYETMQGAYIAEQSNTGTFASIGFNVPNSVYFEYVDDFATATGAGASAKLKADKNIGACPATSTWSVCVPNHATAAVMRRSSNAECIKLSPATFQEQAAGGKYSSVSDAGICS